jgi:hypothetical protein
MITIYFQGIVRCQPPTQAGSLFSCNSAPEVLKAAIPPSTDPTGWAPKKSPSTSRSGNFPVEIGPPFYQHELK